MILLTAKFSFTNPPKKDQISDFFFTLELWKREHTECIIRFKNWNIAWSIWLLCSQC